MVPCELHEDATANACAFEYRPPAFSVIVATPEAQRLISRAELLAAAGAASAENLAATRSSLASEETVAACTHEVRGLECPLHRIVLTKEFRSVSARTNRANKKGRCCQRPPTGPRD